LAGLWSHIVLQRNANKRAKLRLHNVNANRFLTYCQKQHQQGYAATPLVQRNEKKWKDGLHISNSNGFLN
jgi:hypothetical protein